MPATPTPRLKLPLPSQTDPADVPTDLSKLATALDSGGSGGVGSGVAVDGQGVASTRPAAGVIGRYFFATDVGMLYRDNGTAWTPVGSRVIGYVERNITQSSITGSITPLTGLALPASTYDGTRQVELSGLVNFAKAAADSATHVMLRILDSAGAIVNDAYGYCPAPGNVAIYCARVIVPTGSKGYSLQAFTPAGFLNVTNAAWSWIRAVDIGPAP